MHLHPDYEAVRSQLLNMDPIPSFDDVVHSVMVEETRLYTLSSSHPGSTDIVLAVNSLCSLDPLLPVLHSSPQLDYLFFFCYVSDKGMRRLTVQNFSNGNNNIHNIALLRDLVVFLHHLMLLMSRSSQLLSS